MDESEFWTIIDRCHEASPDDMDRKGELIKGEIGRLSREQALAFWNHFEAAQAQSYDWQLWGAAYVVHGGCGDDTFDDFRASLISRGRRAFKAALGNPDSLAEEPFDESLWFYEGFQYDVAEAVEAKLGQPLPRSGYVNSPPSGKEWDESAVYGLYPNLARKFG